MKYTTEAEILEKAKEAIGETFGSYDINNRLASKGNKGGLGQIIEEGLFGYEINSRKGADFEEANVELKVTPFKKNKNSKKESYSAKERLVLNIIDYMSIGKEDFYDSDFWKKNQTLLLMFYLYEKELERSDYKIKDVILYKYPEEDLEIIKDDYEYILNKIMSGKAHELSEADTMYLGACSKGASKNSLRSQPYSEVDAMQRAFSLKQSYMTSILRNYVLGDKKNEKIIKDISEIKETNFSDYVVKQISKHYGKTQNQLKSEFGIIGNPKSLNSMIISRVLGCNTDVGESDEFLKSGIKIKTIRYNKAEEKIQESMSFPTFKFKELIEETWENSTLRDMFESTKWLFVIFTYNSLGELVLEKAFFWKMPVEVLDSEVYDVWEKTKKVLIDGVILRKSKSKVYNNLPKKSESRVCHVRPHTSQSSYEAYNPYADELPNGDWMTKQSFWLNNSYLIDIIKENLNNLYTSEF